MVSLTIASISGPRISPANGIALRKPRMNAVASTKQTRKRDRSAVSTRNPARAIGTAISRLRWTENGYRMARENAGYPRF